MPPVLSEPRRAFFRVLAGTVVPGAAGLDEAGWRRFFEIVERALASRPSALRRQFLLFLTVLRWLPALRWGAPLDALSPERRAAALRWFQDGPVGLLRKGFWGTKTLVFMGYYGRPEAGEALGYRPGRGGSAALRR